MQHRKPAGIGPQWRIPEPPQALVTVAAMAGTVALPLLLLTALVPRPLILPVVCLVAVAFAAMVSAFAWRWGTSGTQQRITAWDVAGGLAFIGIAAGVLSTPDQVMTLTQSAMVVSELR